MKSQKIETNKTRPVIYIGPSFLGLSKNTVFREGFNRYPDHVARMIEKNPAIGQLIVPIEAAQSDRLNIKLPGHILNTFYKQALKGGQ